MHISVSSQTTLQNIANYFAFALYDSTAPGVLLDEITPPKPYGNPLQISFPYNCLNGHTYIIKLWESVDGTPTGVVRNSFSQTVNGSSVNIRLNDYLEVDITPGLDAGGTAYDDPTLDGWDYTLYRNGSLQEPNDTGNSDPVYHKDATGFTLVGAGDRFEANQKFTLVFLPQIIAAPDGTPSNIFSTGRIITANETLTVDDMNQALLIRSATSNIVLGLPSLVGVAEFKFFNFYSVGGNHLNAVINAAGTDKFLFPTDKGQIIIGQCESLKIFKAFGKWNVENDLPGARMVGELIYNYGNKEINTLECKGQIVNRADYPRLWAYVQTLGAALVTDANWTGTFYTKDAITYYTYKGCFSSGNGTTTFRLPLLHNMALIGVDGATRESGSFVNEQGLDHQHETTSGTLPSTLFGRGITDRLLGKYSGTGVGKTDLTSKPVTAVGTAITRFGTKNLIDNVGAYALIRI